MGSDHAGYHLKEILRNYLSGMKIKVIDIGTDNPKPVDYPDIAEKLGLAITEGDADRAILICGSGVGASVAVNKIPGIRAGICHDCYSARQGVEHDDINVLVLGARVVGEELAKEIVSAFLEADFSTGERHIRRLSKISALEKKYLKD
ncbi:MAG: ribose 5-phosphate isomerase B [Candidatus Krumholzibacteriales bacterium]